MAESSIEWTDATWNPTTGCSKVSPGCKHCYAEVMHARLTAMGQAKYAEPFEVVRPYPPHLAQPLGWKKPRRIFVNSMSDLFHEGVPDEYIAAVFGVMAITPQHTYQILTKRAERLPRWFEWVQRQEFLRARIPPFYAVTRAMDDAGVDWSRAEKSAKPSPYPWPLPNVWIGVSVEDQRRANERIPELLKIPAAVRFLSVEPLLEEIDLARGLGRCDCYRSLEADGVHAIGCRIYAPRIDWVIVGGESGHDARPFDVAWARTIIQQCRAAGVAVFVKQLGSTPLLYGPLRQLEVVRALRSKKGSDPTEWPEDLRVRQYPEARS